MDIQRKCFEESNNVNPDWSFKFDEELQQYIALDSEMELQVDEFNEHWDTFRAGWQAAKAQAVPEKDAVIKKLSDQLYAQEMKASAARVLCETACELLDGYAHQDAMVILNDLEQAMKEQAND